MKKSANVGRRGFLQGVALGGLASITQPGAAQSESSVAPGAPAAPQPPANPRGERVPVAPPASEESLARDEGVTYSSCGGDYIVDVMRSLGIEYFAASPGNTFMGTHEAVINYGMLSEPKLRSILTMHEEASVAIAHGYAKIEGKPMACMMHSTVGLQHASMAIYNAYADRVPIFMMTGHLADVADRHGEVAWTHSAMDGPAMVRDFTKWDDTPQSLRHFSESAVHAYKLSMTPPYGPTLLAVDTFMQEDEIPGGAAAAPSIPRLVHATAPAGELGAVREAAALLVKAERPVLYADRAVRNADGLKLMIELAELLQAPVCDSQNRLNFPWRHPLNQSRRQAALLSEADVVLMLEAGNPFDVVTRRSKEGGPSRVLEENAKAISISSVGLGSKGNYGANTQRYAANIDLEMAADAQATLPLLIEEIRRQMPTGRTSVLEARGKALAQAHQEELERSRDNARYGWDRTPISMPRLFQELYAQIRIDDWSLVSGTNLQSWMAQQFWDADKHYQYIGANGAYGVGYMTPAGLGAALANQKYGRLSISIVGDGDLMFGPGVLWTAARERIPLLYVVHNNRGYHMEYMQMQVIANRRQRGVDRLGIACGIDNPYINYAQMATSMGMYAEGPVEKPHELGPALRRALAVVRKGEPALVDVVSEGR